MSGGMTTAAPEVIEVDWGDIYLYGVDEATRMAVWRAIAASVNDDEPAEDDGSTWTEP